MNIKDELLGWAQNEVEPPTSTEGVWEEEEVCDRAMRRIESSGENQCEKENHCLAQEDTHQLKPLPVANVTGGHATFSRAVLLPRKRKTHPPAPKTRLVTRFRSMHKTSTFCSRLKHYKPQLNLNTIALKSSSLFSILGTLYDYANEPLTRCEIL